MKANFRSSVGLLAVAGLLLALCTSSAWATDRMEGWGVVMKRDLRASTLQIDDTVYEVTGATTFRGLDGAPLTFASLPIFDVYAGIFDLADATKVEFVAMRGRDGQWVLESAAMIDKLPD